MTRARRIVMTVRIQPPKATPPTTVVFTHPFYHRGAVPWPSLLGRQRFFLERPEVPGAQTLRRIEPPRVQQFQHVRLVPDILLEHGGEVTNAVRRMAITRTDPALAQCPGHAQRELVLLQRASPVAYLDLVHHLEHRHLLRCLLRRHLEGWPSVAAEMDGIEKMPERVRHCHEPAGFIQDTPQFSRFPDARHVRLQPNNDHMPQVRRHFHSLAHEETALRPELPQQKRIPEPVVLREIDPREPDAMRFFDQLVRGERRGGCAARRMDVHVYDGAGHELRRTFPVNPWFELHLILSPEASATKGSVKDPRGFRRPQRPRHEHPPLLRPKPCRRALGLSTR